jgi:1-acyl-sn-glycerol-3-phosphate acyltransferase
MLLALTPAPGASICPSERRVALLYALKVVGIAINTALVAPMVAVAAAIDGCRAYDLSRLWATINLALCGVQRGRHARARLDPTEPYVFMSNHASHFDVLAVVAALPEFQLRWVAKSELADIPIFGWAMRRAGHVIIDRSNPEQALASLRAARTMMDAGISVMIFPEGTREGHDHELLPLKKGGFLLALERACRSCRSPCAAAARSYRAATGASEAARSKSSSASRFPSRARTARRSSAGSRRSCGASSASRNPPGSPHTCAVRPSSRRWSCNEHALANHSPRRPRRDRAQPDGPRVRGLRDCPSTAA